MGILGIGTRGRRSVDYLRGAARPATGPASLSIETTVRCNLRCPMCPRTGAGYPAEELPSAILYPLLEAHRALGGDYVYLYGLGEPLMDPRIFDILARCRALGLGTVLSTNGCFLDAEARRRLLEVGCDHVIVSVDGTTQETYGRYRVGGILAEVEANLMALAAEKNRGGHRMDLVAQLVCLSGNADERAAFTARWGRVRGITAARLKAEELGYEGPEASGRGEDPAHTGRESPCHILWRGPMIVRYTGEVFPCHPMAGGKETGAEGAEAAGDLRTQSLEEIWWGPRMTALRAAHGEGRWGEIPPCAACPITRPRRALAGAAMVLPGTAVQRILPIAEGLRARGLATFTEGKG